MKIEEYASDMLSFALFDSPLVGIFHTTLEGQVVFANKTFLRMLDFDSLAEAKESNIIDRYKNPDDRQQILNLLKSTGEIEKHQVEFISKHGKILTTLLSIKLDQGEIFGTIVDISEAKEAEYQITALASVVESSDDIIVVKDKALRVVATNSAFVKASGQCCIEEMLGKTDAEIFNVPPESEPIRSYMADELLAQSLPKGEYLLREEPVITPDGEVRTFLTKKYPIYDKDDQLVGTGNISRDVTENQLAERKLRESEEKYRMAMDVSTDCFWDWDIHSGEVYFSKNWIAKMSENSGKPTIDTWLSRIHPSDKAEVQQSLDLHLAGKTESWNTEHRLMTGKGNWQWFLGRGQVTSRDIDDSPSRMLATLTDISEAKRSQLEREVLIDKLQSALDEIKTLRGTLPICMHCKQIRDDKGYWTRIEEYIESHSEALFSHGLCEECCQKHYPELNHK